MPAVQIGRHYFLQCENPVAIHSPYRSRQLIGMPAALDCQPVGYQWHLVLRADPKPEIVIFAHRKCFIETAGSLKEGFRHHHGGWTHQTKLQAPTENVTGRFLMNAPRVNPNPIANPDLVCLADVKFRMLVHKTSLSLELTVKPKIVRIQERYIVTARLAYAQIPRRRNSLSGRREKSQP